MGTAAEAIEKDMRTKDEKYFDTSLTHAHFKRLQADFQDFTVEDMKAFYRTVDEDLKEKLEEKERMELQAFRKKMGDLPQDELEEAAMAVLAKNHWWKKAVIQMIFFGIGSLHERGHERGWCLAVANPDEAEALQFTLHERGFSTWVCDYAPSWKRPVSRTKKVCWRMPW